MKRILALFLMLVLLAGTLAACSDETSPTAEESAVGDATAGRRLYETGGETAIPCASCHTLDGTELVGPSMQGIASRAETRTEQSVEDYLRESIVNPSAYIVEGYEDVMNKQYGETFTVEEVNNLIAFLLTQ